MNLAAHNRIKTRRIASSQLALSQTFCTDTIWVIIIESGRSLVSCYTKFLGNLPKPRAQPIAGCGVLPDASLHIFGLHGWNLLTIGLKADFSEIP
jgi:hypothetical protein